MSEWEKWIQVFFYPKGRIKRLPFFIGNITLYLLLFIIAIKLKPSSKDFLLKGDAWTVTGVTSPIGLMVVVLYVYSAFILMIKRLRDINYSPWLCLLTFIPAIGPLFFLYLFVEQSAYQTPYSSNQNHYIDAA